MKERLTRRLAENTFMVTMQICVVIAMSFSVVVITVVTLEVWWGWVKGLLVGV